LTTVAHESGRADRPGARRRATAAAARSPWRPCRSRAADRPCRCARAAIRAGGSRSRSPSASVSWTRRPPRQSTTIRARSLKPWRSSPAPRIHGDDLLHGRRVLGIAQSLVAGRTSGVVAGHGRGRATSTGGVERCRDGHVLLRPNEPRGARPGVRGGANEVCEDRGVEDLVGVAIALVAKHPAVRRVEFAGSRSRGTHEELSDWDFAVETSDFAAVARDLPTLVAPLDLLAGQWEPMGHFPVYQVFLRGPTKVEYLVLEHSQDAMAPVNPSRETLFAINTHFWDWIWWVATKGHRRPPRGSSRRSWRPTSPASRRASRPAGHLAHHAPQRHRSAAPYDRSSAQSSAPHRTPLPPGRHHRPTGPHEHAAPPPATSARPSRTPTQPQPAHGPRTCVQQLQPWPTSSPRHRRHTKRKATHEPVQPRATRTETPTTPRRTRRTQSQPGNARRRAPRHGQRRTRRPPGAGMRARNGAAARCVHAAVQAARLTLPCRFQGVTIPHGHGDCGPTSYHGGKRSSPARRLVSLESAVGGGVPHPLRGEAHPQVSRSSLRRAPSLCSRV
jgi:hypothetical protein